jgi:tRNA (guanine26-N2/guanine27-N2)-dimethyltransferase
LWLGPLHDNDFIDGILKDLEGMEDVQFGTIQRIQGMLRMAREEISEPLYYKPGHLGKIFKCSTIPAKLFASTLLNGGFLVSSSHAAPGVLKTNASPSYVTKILKAFKNRIDQHGRMKTDLPDETDGINFAHHPGSHNENTEGFVRFQTNPTANWGPGSIAKRSKEEAFDQISDPQDKKAKTGSEEETLAQAIDEENSTSDAIK